jgi:hypothetical protein
MEASEMLDVIHFYLEEDFAGISQESIQIRSLSRENLYQELYGVTYQFPVKNSESRKGKSFDVEMLPFDNEDGPDKTIKPFDPKQKAKPFVAPTPVSVSEPLPFGNILDAPLK